MWVSAKIQNLGEYVQEFGSTCGRSADSDEGWGTKRERASSRILPWIHPRLPPQSRLKYPRPCPVRVKLLPSTTAKRSEEPEELLYPADAPRRVAGSASG